MGVDQSEVHIRREITQVLYCDFLSMYPTVCTLMGLWRFVTAQGMTWQDTINETQEFLNKITLSDLQKQDNWRALCTIVQVLPNDDIFPVRAKYSGDPQYTIGSNYLTSENPLWFTLADCISTKLLTGRSPEIVQALSFFPMAMQENLTPVNIAGNNAYRVDPCDGDFFKQIIDLRTTIKKKSKFATAFEKSTLDKQQGTLKILANSTSYGIFVELNVEEEKLLQTTPCYGAGDRAMPISKKKFEAPGTYFHPLLATLITGAARLMLAITERRACDAGLDWAFCDTDSMAIAKPESMPEDEFYKRARLVQEWFTPLNPYIEKAPLLKIEDYNYGLSDSNILHPLYCYAISSKRYALFNFDINGSPILRKVSAHGLGHLVAPYHREGVSNLEDVLPWQLDFWLTIIRAELDGNPNQPDFEGLPNFNKPAISRYGATTPALEKWFEPYNQDKPYCDRVKPFNFLLAMQGKRSSQIRPVSSYDKNHKKALAQCFDRMTGKAVKPSQLKSNRDALGQYHLHPETKFLNGNYLDKGKTERRHLRVKVIQHIGKEANKWEEQYFTGHDPEAQIEYGICTEQQDKILESLMRAVDIYGAKHVAVIAKLSPSHVLRIYKSRTIPSESTLSKLQSAIKFIEDIKSSEQDQLKQIKEIMKERKISIRMLAGLLGLDASNLAKIFSRHRKCPQNFTEAIKDFIKLLH